MVHERVPNYVIQQVFNFGVSHPRIFFLTHSGYLSVFLFTRDNMLMWASDWPIALGLPFVFLSVGLLWSCINFLRYKAASDPNQRHSGRTEEIRRLVMTCCKLYLLRHPFLTRNITLWTWKGYIPNMYLLQIVSINKSKCPEGHKYPWPAPFLYVLNNLNQWQW